MSIDPNPGLPGVTAIRVLIADDHPLVRGGLRELLARQPGIQIVGEAEDYASIMRCLRGTDCDVLVLDIVLPGRDGIDVLRIVKSGWPRVRVLMISGLQESHFGVRALRAGADGYVSKLSDPEVIAHAVTTVAAGRKFVTAELGAQLAEHISDQVTTTPHALLSDRELATFRRIVAGRKPREIAIELSVSAKTVSVYRARILQKLGLRTNADLAAYAIQHDLFQQ